MVDFTRRWRRLAAHHRVRATMLFALVYVAFSTPHGARLAIGAGIVAVGQGIRLWASGHLQRNVSLARGGPYQLVRHPLYLGSLMMGTGLAVAADHALAWLGAFVVLYLVFYLPAMHVEELRLQSLFGAEYQEFMVEVPRLFPRMSTPPQWPDPAPPRSYDWGLTVENRELRSAAAMLALLGLQAVKLLLAA